MGRSATEGKKRIIDVYFVGVGWDSAFGIAARYMLDGPGIESPWGRGFAHPFRSALGPINSVHWVEGLFAGDKADGAWR